MDTKLVDDLRESKLNGVYDPTRGLRNNITWILLDKINGAFGKDFTMDDITARTNKVQAPDWLVRFWNDVAEFTVAYLKHGEPLFDLMDLKTEKSYGFSSKDESKLDEWDQMELKFGRVIGENPKITLAKIMGRKSNPNLSYLEIEKLLDKKNGSESWGEIEDIPLDLPDEKKTAKSIQGLNLVRPVPKKGTKFETTNKAAEADSKKISSRPVKNSTEETKSSVPDVILRKPSLFNDDDDNGANGKSSRFGMKPNLSLKMGKEPQKERIKLHFFNKWPFVLFRDLQAEMSSGEETSGMSVDSMLKGNQKDHPSIATDQKVRSEEVIPKSPESFGNPSELDSFLTTSPIKVFEAYPKAGVQLHNKRTDYWIIIKEKFLWLCGQKGDLRDGVYGYERACDAIWVGVFAPNYSRGVLYQQSVTGSVGNNASNQSALLKQVDSKNGEEAGRGEENDISGKISGEMKANVTVNCVHPGIVRTRLTRDREGLIIDLVFLLASKLLKTIPQAGATTCYVGTNPRLENKIPPAYGILLPHRYLSLSRILLHDYAHHHEPILPQQTAWGCERHNEVTKGPVFWWMTETWFRFLDLARGFCNSDFCMTMGLCLSYKIDVATTGDPSVCAFYVVEASDIEDIEFEEENFISMMNEPRGEASKT
ncbi:hypothetical protein PHJA_000708700 [Phtheirospermum japonicum]|uniref:Uncharacterized protein n=1 Tax=Phtheirospermum japonicum TaxID=374723 RepID=A0A830BDI2_9LAMI|nr:hypothetical protein PHJA_000708700 [Phtheirospermum japonicum]